MILCVNYVYIYRQCSAAERDRELLNRDSNIYMYMCVGVCVYKRVTAALNGL